MTPAIGYVIAGLFAAAPLANEVARTQTQIQGVIYECPQPYRLTATSTGYICLRRLR
jgi:hypothetical protein